MHISVHFFNMLLEVYNLRMQELPHLLGAQTLQDRWPTAFSRAGTKAELGLGGRGCDPCV